MRPMVMMLGWMLRWAGKTRSRPYAKQETRQMAGFLRTTDAYCSVLKADWAARVRE